MISPPADGRRERRFPNFAAWANVVLGFLVFLLRYDSPRPSFEVHRNLFLTGIVISFAALAAVIAHDGFSTRNYWSVVDLVAGVWLVVSVQFYPSSAPIVLQGQMALGALIVLVAVIALATDALTKRRET